MQEMNKQEAVQAMTEGKKVTHKLFDKGQWVTMINGVVQTKAGRSNLLFFELRQDEPWQTGWSIFEEGEEPTVEAESSDESTKVKNTDILAKMIAEGKDIRMTTQFIGCKATPFGAEVIIGIDRKSLLDLLKLDLQGNSKYFFMMYMIDKKQYDEIAQEK